MLEGMDIEMTAKSIYSPIHENNSKQKPQVLARAYSFILSWPDPPVIKTEPTTHHPDGDLVVGSGNEYPVFPEDQSSCDDAQASGEQEETYIMKYITNSAKVQLFPNSEVKRSELLKARHKLLTR